MAKEEVFSFRIVDISHYMSRPIYGLDPCFSEFRAKEIKSVPVLRIFGSSSDGIKTCLHIHGVLPYFYVPYESNNNAESFDKFVYQLCENLDKVLNVSLGQSTSQIHHIFKVQQVKAFPFYGYHRREHLFLKIYMYNPRLLKRASNLLQNGALNGKKFQAFDSHVPYRLQFLIDYNLFPMSFLHVPMNTIKVRQPEDIPLSVSSVQILDKNIEKISTSRLEIDINGAHILNRIQLQNEMAAGKKLVNPGIESIWQDEDIRRKLLHEKNENLEFPPLEVPAPDERLNIKPTDSEIFYRSALERKLKECASQTLDTSLDNTLLPSKEAIFNPKEKKGKFNVTKLLKNSIYPEECSQNENFLNATIVQDHLNGTNFVPKEKVTSEVPPENLNEVFDQDTLDEEEILNLSQHPYQNLNLNDTIGCEQGVLDFIKKLDHEDDDTSTIDMNSSLAPFSQSYDNSNKEVLDFLRQLDCEDDDVQEQIHNLSTIVLSDSEDECLNDFTMINEDIEEVLTKLSQTTNLDSVHSKEYSIPQVDGADEYQYTPKKVNYSQFRNRISPNKRSPRTPRSAKRHRYAPLQCISTYSPKSLQATDNSSESDAVSASSEEIFKPNKSVLKRKLKRNILQNICTSKDALKVKKQLKRKVISDDTISISSTESFKPIKVDIKDLDKTEIKITCNLRTPKQSKNKNPLKIQKCAIKLHNISPNRTTSVHNKTPNEQEKSSQQSNKSSTEVKFKKHESVAKKLLRSRITKQLNSNFSNSDKDLDYASDRKRNTSLSVSQNIENNFSKTLTDERSQKFNETEICNSAEKTKDANVQEPSVVIKKVKLKIELKKLKSGNEPDKPIMHSHLMQNLRELGLCLLEKEKLENIPKSEDGSTNKSAENIEGNQSEKAKQIEINQIKTSYNHKNSQTNQIKNNRIENSKKTFKKCKILLRRLNIKNSSPMNNNRHEMQNVRQHDEKLNFTPIPGPSKIGMTSKNLNEVDFNRFSLPEESRNEKNTGPNELGLIPENKSEKSSSPLLEDGDDDSKICSFYETSFFINDSPSMFSDTDSPFQVHSKQFLSNINENEEDNQSRNLCDSLSMRSRKASESMSPLQFSQDSNEEKKSEEINQQNELFSPPDLLNSILNRNYEHEKCLPSNSDKNLPNYEAPEVFNQMPFYSNPDDVRKAKEVGNFALHIPLLSEQLVPKESEKQLLFVKESSCSPHSALKSKDIAGKTNHNTEDNNKSVDINLDDDSPIKIRRQKIAMILNESDNENANDSDNEIDKSLICSPLTPETKSISEQLDTNKTKENGNLLENLTPKSSRNCKVSLKKSSLSKLFSYSRKTINTNQSFRKQLFNDQSLSNDSSDKSRYSNSANIKSVPIEILLSDEVNVEDAIALKNTSLNETAQTQIIFSDTINSANKKNSTQNRDVSFGLTGSSLNNTYGFKANLENLQHAKADINHYYLTTMSLEIFVKTRSNLHPNPAYDEICGIFYAVLNDVPENHKIPTKLSGYILLAQSNDINPKMTGVEGKVTIVKTEEELFDALLKLVRFWDPDILAGYEVEMNSWGYILDRSKALKNDFIQLLSRVPSQKKYENLDDEESKESFNDLDYESRIYGRILLDVWRLLRSEIALTSYTFENVMYHISHRRVPSHSYQKLTEWYMSSSTRWIVLEYYLERVNGVMELLDQLDLIGRTCEMAKLIGIQFYEILSRGSQYRVESMMLRIAKPNNLIPMSPSPQQRLHMRAPEYLPLILEPQSRFYADPLIVLDFQSLYPSVMIAHNYCFSTCLGRVEHLGSSSPFEFGVSMLKVSPTMLRKLIAYDMITISPCGAVFIKQTIREGVLPQMLREILDTRIMVKKSMKLHKNNQVLQRVLHSRQLALKLMANVTYGYTAANFSGRMPCVEVGDSVVAKGRETLERAIKLVEATPRWGAEVVYGDTDSLFVLCPGKTRETAFKIGEEIAEAVTKDNPFPVKLKLEKVYQPAILQTKKRYVGFMYETPDQTEPIYEAKGIETVRRDGCPAVAKMLEKSLRIIFQTKDVSKVKQYVCRQFTKILQGKANIQDLIFAKEFRGRFGYKPGACVPALELTRKWMLIDPRKEPRRGERVPYIVTNGPPGLPIIRLIRCPHDVLNDEGLKINAIYYITRAIIPALNRCFLLIGADVNEWFAELPRKNSQLLQFIKKKSPNCRKKFSKNEKKTTISQYFSTTNCVIDCGNQTKSEICNDCKKDIQHCVITLQNKISKLERAYYLTEKVCQSCSERLENINCQSLNCPVLFVKEVKSREYKQVAYYNELINKIILQKY